MYAKRFFLIGLATITGLAFTSESISSETIVVGADTFMNTKFFPTNCYNSNTGQHTDEFWTYFNPSNTDWRYPDDKYYADPNGNLWWEGNENIYLGPVAGIQYQVQLATNAASQNEGTLVGGLRATNNNNSLPCYKTPEDQKRVDFFNGWVCYRLYVCSTVPHIVTTMVVSSEKVSIEVTQQPYENMMSGLNNQLSRANGQVAQILEYSESFTNEGNTYTFVAQVENNGNYNLFWMVNALAQISNSIPHVNWPSSEFDEAYNGGDTGVLVIAGDAQFPQSASVVIYVGLDHTAYTKIDFFQSGFSPAPPPGTSCNNQGWSIGSGTAGIIAAIVGAAGVFAAPETGGLSLAVAAGVFGVASGSLGIVSAVAC